MKVTMFIFVISMLLVFSSCEGQKNSREIKKIKKGMTFDEVKNIMGNNYDVIDDYFDSLVFQQIYTSELLNSDKYRIYYLKADSVVIDIGYGD